MSRKPELSGLREALGDDSGLDLDAAWGDYCEAAGAPDEAGFLEHLRERQLISGELYREAHAGLRPSEAELALATQTFTHSSSQGEAAAERYRPEPPPRESLAPYVLGPVGKGSQGSVHVARDPVLRRKMAFKQLTLDDETTGLDARRFIAEAQITAQLDHPNIVPVYGFEIAPDGAPAYTMKLVHGVTLGDFVAQARAEVEEHGKPAPERVLARRLELFLKICDALAYAHDKEVIHRDLKPANIMVGRFGELYVMDWGLARPVNRPDPEELAGPPSHGQLRISEVASEGTADGAVIGTPAYMSPEQARGAVVDKASDVYTLGLLLHELTTLQRPYPGCTLAEIVDRATRARLGEIDPRVAGERLAPELLAIVKKATVLRPQDRYQSVQLLADDLRRYLHGEAPTALPDNAGRAARRWLVRHLRVAVLVTTGLLLAAGLAVGWLQTERRAALDRERAQATERERLLTDLLSAVGQRAQRIANHFLWHESLVAGLAATARQSLAQIPAEKPRIYSGREYRDVRTAPPGTVHSPHYGALVNPDFGFYSVAPGVAPDVAERDLRLLASLREHLHEVFLGAPGARRPADEKERRARILQHQVAVEWAFVALESSGAMVCFPGRAGHDDGKYDSRRRPWYRSAKESWKRGDPNRRHWTTPYEDGLGQGWLISCTQAIEDTQGHLFGVAGLDLALRDVEELLVMDEVPGFLAAYLLDRNGEVVGATAPRPETKELGKGKPFAVPAVQEGVGAETSGHVRERLGELDVHVAWTRLPHIGWTLVLVAEAAAGE